MRLLAQPFEVEHTCTECGEPMLRPVSVWRCKRAPGTHTATGPEIATELRLRGALDE